MNSLKHSFLSIAVSVCLLSGCGGGGSEATDTSQPQQVQDAAASEPAGSASVSGSIRFTGTAPQPQPLNMDRECVDLRGEPATSESIVTGEDNSLQWVFVYVKEGLGNQNFAPSSEPVTLDQEGCMYHPHVMGVQTGQPIRILNSDPLLHNIHAMPEENRPFNFGMPTAGQEREETFRVPEVMVRIKCDVHPWMLAWAGVTGHPYFAVSDASGSYSIEGLPAGNYVIEAWHEQLGTQTQSVTVQDGESVSLDFTFGESAATS